MKALPPAASARADGAGSKGATSIVHSDYRQARQRMVARQLRARDIRSEPILSAFESVPRHRFVDAALAGEAYSDRALPIGHGQTISQPYMVAVMTELLAPEQGQRVLEIGTGSGYQAAILSKLVRSVFTIERIAALAERAQAALADLKITNVLQLVSDGSVGWKAYAPYDGIMVTAGAPRVPYPLVRQLTDGGRLVVPTGSRHSQKLTVLVRVGDAYEQEQCVPCTFVPLVGEEGWDEG